MRNILSHIEIKNFKSIKDLKIDNLSAINLFIGRPNVGKSNILEALSIFCLPYLKLNTNQKLANLIRADFINELFHDGDTEKSISITSNLSRFYFSMETNEVKTNSSPLGISEHMTGFGIKDVNLSIGLSDNMHITVEGSEIEKNPFKSYLFNPTGKLKKTNVPFLLPPFGKNLLSIIERNPTLKKDLINLFKEYNLDLVFDRASQELKIMKEQKGKEIFLIPYSSIADTLQRVIFYKTAIASNNSSILIFEEPEANAFPPYISHITHEIIDSSSNQFILSTHSPYVINDFLEHAREELSIYLTDYKNGETIVKRLSKKELDEIYQYGVDLLFNHERFL